MSQIRVTRDCFLFCMSVIYLFAFGSYYVQIPGLYGDNGILPVRNVLQKEATSWKEFLEQPTLLRLMPKIDLDVEGGLDLLALGGVFVSFLMIISKIQRACTGFILLWIMYFSLYQVGQTFLWFQWDILLLEAGFLAILVAPMNLKALRWSIICYHQHDRITMWLVKWLLFRLMFASGVVKLTSQCPTWWGLTALNWHYESQCIPTPLAWYFHQLPDWFQKMSVAATYVIEIAIPFFFFAPGRALRIFAFYAQVFLQVLIILSGNYNFFNLLTIALCISLVDDEWLIGWVAKVKTRKDIGLDAVPVIGRAWRLFKRLFTVISLGVLTYYTIKLFNLHFADNFTIESKVMFSNADFENFLKSAVPISIYIGAAALGIEIVKAIVGALKVPGTLWKLWSLFGCVVFGTAAVGMFAISLVPYTDIEMKTQQSLWPTIHHWHSQAQKFELTNAYGLFRSMTGVGGRPEVIVEGSDELDYGWKEYEFYYKPGSLSRKLPFVAPHQPRLDWQMWFAALGSYQHNQWFLNMVYRLLTGQPEVLELIHTNPFPKKPPKYIKASLYHYSYTRMDKKHTLYSDKNWWTRRKQYEYLPVLDKDNTSLVHVMKANNIIQGNPSKKVPPTWIKSFLMYIRRWIGQMEGFTFLMSLLTAALAISFLNPISL